VTTSVSPVALTVKDCDADAVPTGVEKPVRLVGVALMTGPAGGKAKAGMAEAKMAARATKNRERKLVEPSVERWDVFIAAGG